MFGLKNGNCRIENNGNWWQSLKLCLTSITVKITLLSLSLFVACNTTYKISPYECIEKKDLKRITYLDSSSFSLIKQHQWIIYRFYTQTYNGKRGKFFSVDSTERDFKYMLFQGSKVKFTDSMIILKDKTDTLKFQFYESMYYYTFQYKQNGIKKTLDTSIIYNRNWLYYVNTEKHKITIYNEPQILMINNMHIIIRVIPYGYICLYREE